MKQYKIRHWESLRVEWAVAVIAIGIAGYVSLSFLIDRSFSFARFAVALLSLVVWPLVCLALFEAFKIPRFRRVSDGKMFYGFRGRSRVLEPGGVERVVINEGSKRDARAPACVLECAAGQIVVPDTLEARRWVERALVAPERIPSERVSVVMARQDETFPGVRWALVTWSVAVLGVAAMETLIALGGDPLIGRSAASGGDQLRAAGRRVLDLLLVVLAACCHVAYAARERFGWARNLVAIIGGATRNPARWLLTTALLVDFVLLVRLLRALAVSTP